MTEVDDQGLSPEERLASLGIPRKNIRVALDILRAVTLAEDLAEEFKRRHYTCDKEQFLLPMFRPLYQGDQAIRASVLGQLAQTGIPEEVIEKYIIGYSNQPYMILHFQHQDIDPEAREALIGQVAQTMLDTLRQYLGFRLLPQSD